MTFMEIRPIAHIHTDFPEKFGIPRQSNIVKNATGVIKFEPEFNSPDAIKGMEEFDYLWLLWEFQGVERESFSPTVRPPRVGGNTRLGVFATRSPFRPNPIGLSSVRLEKIEYTKDGPLIHVSGVDLRDNTPIFDIKPYLTYADSHPEASEGFAGRTDFNHLEVIFPEELLQILPEEKRETAVALLREDPRPAYHNDPDRIYGMNFASFDIRFKVSENVLEVVEVACIND
ncbi:MAG: tRNA (N6-threonylcarbamoyladenosine(37)-N6)-methyltransferase TrmO [Lachnospiraceae bacterium]|nr:tRNA (N6-threonylcarbamoyladenosine(37)-N6)-methyltransferase TrmO [Lachnospiraceae bacterium]